METRQLQIWDAHFDSFPDSEYQGPYLEQYEDPTKALKLNRPEVKAMRIGLIFDRVKMRVAVFRQAIKSHDDPRPTDIVLGDNCQGREFPAWSTDPDGKNYYCDVWDFTVRDPTDEERCLMLKTGRKGAAKKRQPGRPRVDPRQHKAMIQAIKEAMALGGNFLKMAATNSGFDYIDIKLAWDREQKRKAKRRVNSKTEKPLSSA
jgi:hypothetical protein